MSFVVGPSQSLSAADRVGAVAGHGSPRWVNVAISVGFLLAVLGIFLATTETAEVWGIVLTVFGVTVSAALGLWDAPRRPS